jgi:hypothetical protein
LEQVTTLGDFTEGSKTEGQSISFNSAALLSFLNRMAGSQEEVATLIIERITGNSGQSRFATKEATNVFSTPTGSVPLGTYAPQLMLQLLAATPGDFDGDGDVDGRDFVEWQRDPSVGDLADWQANYGTNSNAIGAVAVPEPQMLCFIYSSLVLCTVRRVYCILP